jgi:hypothetical protein
MSGIAPTNSAAKGQRQGTNAGPAPSTALVTASYAGDFDRCRLLCETADQWLTGAMHHYILVAGHDVALFRNLENPKRTVVDERDILPRWLKAFRDPSSMFTRYIWLSLRTMPLRGWHVQQLRRIAVARHVAEDGLFYSDSDVVFVKPFDCSALWRGGKLRLYRKDDAIGGQDNSEQAVWSRNAGKVLAINAPARSPHDYISTLIAWRRDTVLDLMNRIENVSGRSWAQAIGRDRRFSECMIYGRFADEVDDGARHFHAAQSLCRVQWTEPLKDRASLVGLLESLDAHEIGAGIQSFLGVDPAEIKSCIAEVARRGGSDALGGASKRRMR